MIEREWYPTPGSQGAKNEAANQIPDVLSVSERGRLGGLVLGTKKGFAANIELARKYGKLNGGRRKSNVLH